jgi:hypothetical protein
MIALDLPFARLFDDVIVPYQSDEPFFIDGVPCEKRRLKKIKVLEQHEGAHSLYEDFHSRIRLSGKEIQRLYAEQYYVRLEALLRESTNDVTSQIIKAYKQAIEPNIGEYLEKRKSLIELAYKAFSDGIKLLGSI